MTNLLQDILAARDRALQRHNSSNFRSKKAGIKAVVRAKPRPKTTTTRPFLPTPPERQGVAAPSEHLTRGNQVVVDRPTQGGKKQMKSGTNVIMTIKPKPSSNKIWPGASLSNQSLDS